jgi:peptide/nickel transport system substrate-binding protein
VKALRHLLIATVAVAFLGTASAERLVIAQGQDIVWLNPMKTTAQVNLNAATQIVETLMVFDYDIVGVVPRLATEWERVDDLTLRVHLRDDVYFTNGEHFDAEAAKFSLETAMQEAAMSGSLTALDRIEVVGPYTIDVITSEPYPLLEISLARAGYMVPPAYFAEVGDDGFNEAPIGSGPFILSERSPGERVVLVRNDDYWGGPSALSEVEFRPIQEDGARLAALQTGEVHLATNLPHALYNRTANAANVEAVTVEGARTMLLILDGRPDSPIADKRIRQAINYAIDRELLLEVLFAGRGSILRGQQVTESYFGFNPELDAYPYDPERARELLAEAGHPDGLTLDFKYSFGRYAGDKETSEAIAAMLADVGIQTNQIVLEGGEFLNQLVTLQLTPMAFVGYATAPDASFQYNINLSGERYAYYSNPEYDALVRAAEATMDPAERLDLYRQISELAYDDPPYAFLFAPDDLYGVSSRVSGWQPRPDQAILLSGVTLE